MPTPSPRSPKEVDSILRRLSERPQIDFELDFFDAILARVPDFAEVLQAQADNLAAKGRHADVVSVEERYVRLRPRDPAAHYRLARRYARLQNRDLALSTLRRAVELGYRDVRAISRDADLESLRKDPRFRQLLHELTGK